MRDKMELYCCTKYIDLLRFFANIYYNPVFSKQVNTWVVFWATVVLGNQADAMIWSLETLFIYLFNI